MATTNFYLDKADKQGKSFIIMTYLAGGQKFRHSVKIKVLPNKWISRKQRLKENSTEDQYINSHIDKLETIIKDAQTHSLLFNQEIDFSFVKQRFYEALGGKKDVKRNFIESFEEYIQLSRTTKGVKTTDRYITCFNHLKEFRKVKRYELTFERINQHFYESFTDFLFNHKRQLNNTAGNYIKTLKVFMNFAYDRGYCQPHKDVKKFEVFKEDGELIYLSEAELFAIIYLELKSEKLNVVRDNFCFACFTGLRYSDISKLQVENIKDDYIEIKTEKTRDFLRIPLNQHAKAILLKNGGRLPKLFSNQKTNEYLKEIGELAGITESILITKYRGVEKVEFLEPKYKFISSHTARRTFVTLSLEKGMRPETVMSITGHKDYKTFKKYIKLTDKVKLAEINTIWAPKLHVA
ncbi:MAG: Phage integrase SAM-like protein [Mucilaginibacter sp.]|nr:Phage integrase SAM-like protein [Mucilaginibacter sp.]